MKKILLAAAAISMLISCTTGKKEVAENQELDLVASQEAINLFTEGQLAEMSNDYNNSLRHYYRALLIDSTNTIILNAIGNAHIKLENYGNAVLYLQRSALIDEENVETWVLLGEAWLGRQKLQESAEAFEKASLLQPQNMNIRRYLIYIYSNLRENDKLLDQYLDIINKIGFDPEIAFKAADLLFQDGKVTEAELIYLRLLEVDPQNVNALLGLAQIDMFRGDTLDAEQKYQEALQIQPGNPEIDFNYSRLLRQKHDWDGLIDFYKTALDADTTNDVARINIAEAYYWKGDYENSQQYLQPYYSIEGLHEGIAQLIGKVETMLKNYDTGEKFLKYSMKANPNDPGIYFDLAYCFDEAGKSDSAITVLEAGAERYKEQTLYYKYLGQLYSDKQQFDKAIKVLYHALQIEPDDISSLSILANLYYETRDFMRSDSVYEKALVQEPENATLLNNYAYGLAERDTLLVRAHKMSLEAVRQEPKNASYLDTIAWILFKQGKYTEAAKYIEEAIVNDSAGESAEIYYHAGMIYKKTDREKAIEYFRIALERDPDSQESLQEINELEQEK